MGARVSTSRLPHSRSSDGVYRSVWAASSASAPDQTVGDNRCADGLASTRTIASTCRKPAAPVANCCAVVGNFAGAFLGAVLMSLIFTFAWSQDPNPVGQFIAHIGEGRTIGYKEHGLAGMLTLFVRGMLCNWMVSTGVVGAMISTSVSGKVIAMWMPIMVFFYMTFEHSVVNMFLFPSGILMGAHFNWADYFLWNEIPTIVGNIVGGLAFTGLTLYTTHVKTAPKRQLRAVA